MARDRAVDLVLGPGTKPDRHAVLHVRRDLPHADGAHEKEAEPDGDIANPCGRHVEHGEKDPEVEQATAEVSGLEQHEHGQHPDEEERPPVLQAALRQHLALLAHVPGEEDDEHDLRKLARLEAQCADVYPQACAVHSQPEQRQDRQEEQRDRQDAEEVLVCLQPAVIVSQQRARPRRRSRSPA